jgi:integrase
MLRRVSRSSHPGRDCAMILLSAKAGLRACEIAGLDWSMVLDAQGHVSGTLHVRDVIAKKRGGRRIPMHPAARPGAIGAHHGTHRAGDSLLSRRALEGEQHRELVRRALQGARLRRLLVAFGTARLHHDRRPQHPPLWLQFARCAAARGASFDRNDGTLHRWRHLRPEAIGRVHLGAGRTVGGMLVRRHASFRPDSLNLKSAGYSSRVKAETAL